MSSGEFQALYWNAGTRQCVETLSSGTVVSYVGEASAGACKK